ncbi:hypothetical protein HDV63DRAFT_89719 [Trichoderma sp. SZMC 28014]
MKLNIIISTFLLSSSSLAQNLSGLPACAESCALNAIAGSSGCAGPNAKCICTADSFFDAFNSCIGITCTASDRAAALLFTQQFCASAGVTIASPAATLSSKL